MGRFHSSLFVGHGLVGRGSCVGCVVGRKFEGAGGLRLCFPATPKPKPNIRTVFQSVIKYFRVGVCCLFLYIFFTESLETSMPAA